MPRKPKRQPGTPLERQGATRMASPLDSKADTDNVWVENLKTGDSVYRSSRTQDPYPMSPNGLVGSVISVPVKVAKEAYFRRAVSRGALKLLTDNEAFSREEQLVLAEDEAVAETERTMEALEKGASESGSRYKRKNLTDDGSEGKSVTAREVWENRQPAEGPAQVRKSTGKSSDRAAKNITAPAIASDEVPDGPIEAVITEPVKEGEWQSDTGL